MDRVRPNGGKNEGKGVAEARLDTAAEISNGSEKRKKQACISRNDYLVSIEEVRQTYVVRVKRAE